MNTWNLVGTASDYSDKNNWINLPEITKSLDTFYLYPTSNLDMAEDAPAICPIEDEGMRAVARGMYEEQATVFEKSTNVFAPFYRQTNVKVIMGLDGASFEEFQKQEQRTDVYAALDYYFSHCNQGRSFILASHSQGSVMMKLVLGEYMMAHPEYLERMVAAYVIGYTFTPKWFADHPGLRFAEGEADTGVVISWNTEGAENKGQSNLVAGPGALAINPLNWKRDDTYAGVEENLGSRLKNEETGIYEIVRGVADARVDPERGVVISAAGPAYYAPAGVFGTASCHFVDYDLYYLNLQQNIEIRISSWNQQRRR